MAISTLDDTHHVAGFVNPVSARYRLVISNGRASEETSHRTKDRVRAQIRTWQARTMTAVVIDIRSDITIYEGRALGF